MSHAKQPLRKILGGAWSATKGFKKVGWGLFSYLAIYTGIITSVAKIFEKHVVFPGSSVVYVFLMLLVQALLVAPLAAGALSVGLRHLRGESVNVKMIFGYKQYRKPCATLFFVTAVLGLLLSRALMVLYFKMMASHGVAFIAVLVLSLAVGIFYIFTLLSAHLSYLDIVENNSSPMQALYRAYARVFDRFFTSIGAQICLHLGPIVLGAAAAIVWAIKDMHFISMSSLIILACVLAIAVLCLLIWLIPWTILIYSNYYQALFSDKS